MANKYKEAKNILGASYNREVIREKSEKGSKMQVNIGLNIILLVQIFN